MTFSAPMRGVYKILKRNVNPVRLGGVISLSGSSLLLGLGEVESIGAFLLCMGGEASFISAKNEGSRNYSCYYSLGYAFHAGAHFLLLASHVAGSPSHQYSLAALAITYSIAGLKRPIEKLANWKTSCPLPRTQLNYIAKKIPVYVGVLSIGLRAPAFYEAEGIMKIVHGAWGAADVLCNELYKRPIEKSASLARKARHLHTPFVQRIKRLRRKQPLPKPPEIPVLRKVPHYQQPDAS